MKISEILRYAANNCLIENEEVPYRLIKNKPGKARYSCDSFHPSYNPLVKTYDESLKIQTFLKSLGLNTDSFQAFDEFSEGEERQSVRYAWLMFAADIAEEEGIDLGLL